MHKFASTNRSDQFIMLLSADWFAPHWQTFGFVFSEFEQKTVREVARRVVQGFLKDRETYWGADFTEGRIDATLASFLADLREAELAANGLIQLSDALNATGESDQLVTTLWLFSALCEQLCGTTEVSCPPG